MSAIVINIADRRRTETTPTRDPKAPESAFIRDARAIEELAPGAAQVFHGYIETVLKNRGYKA